MVDANETLQILRTTERDQVSTEEAKSIIDQQMSRDARLAKADSILENKGGIEDLSTAVKQLHNKLLKLSRFQARPKESLT